MKSLNANASGVVKLGGKELKELDASLRARELLALA